MESSKRLLGIFLAFLILTIGLSMVRPIVYRKDSRRAEICREMSIHHHWMTPTLQGQPFFTKPPLFYWIGSSIYTLVGRHHVLAIRWVHIVSGLLIFFFFYRFFSDKSPPQIRILMAMILASMYLFQMHFISCDQDILLTLMITVSFFTLSRYLERFRFLDLLIGIVTFACGLLIKGPIIALYVVLPIFIWHFLIHRHFEKLKRIHWIPIILIGSICLIPWILYTHNPQAAKTLMEENANPISNFGLFPSLWYYVWNLTLCTFPWVIFLLFRIKHTLHKHGLYWLQIACALLGMSLFHKHDIRYLLPIFPTIAALVALDADAFHSLCSSSKAFKRTLQILAFIIMLLLLTGLYIITLFNVLTGLLCGLVVITLLFVLLKRPCKSVLVQWCAVLFLVHTLANFFITFNGWDRYRYAFLSYLKTHYSTATIYAYDKEFWGASLNLDRIIPVLTAEELSEKIKQKESFYVILCEDQKRSEYPTLPFSEVYTYTVQQHFGHSYSKRFPYSLLPPNDIKLVRFDNATH